MDRTGFTLSGERAGRAGDVSRLGAVTSSTLIGCRTRTATGGELFVVEVRVVVGTENILDAEIAGRHKKMTKSRDQPGRVVSECAASISVNAAASTLSGERAGNASRLGALTSTRTASAKIHVLD